MQNNNITKNNQSILTTKQPQERNLFMIRKNNISQKLNKINRLLNKINRLSKKYQKCLLRNLYLDIQQINLIGMPYTDEEIHKLKEVLAHYDETIEELNLFTKHAKIYTQTSQQEDTNHEY